MSATIGHSAAERHLHSEHHRSQEQRVQLTSQLQESRSQDSPATHLHSLARQHQTTHRHQASHFPANTNTNIPLAVTATFFPLNKQVSAVRAIVLSKDQLLLLIAAPPQKHHQQLLRRNLAVAGAKAIIRGNSQGLRGKRQHSERFSAAMGNSPAQTGPRH